MSINVNLAETVRKNILKNKDINKDDLKLLEKDDLMYLILRLGQDYQLLQENYHLYIEADKRMQDKQNDKRISQEDLMLELNITQEDLAEINVEIE